MGCEPESKGIADISVSLRVDLFDVGSADISPPRGFHPGCGNTRSGQLLNPSEVVRLASRVFPECLVAAEVAFLFGAGLKECSSCADRP